MATASSLLPIAAAALGLVVLALWFVARAAATARNAIAAREAQLARAQRIGNMGSWSWDVATQTLEWSDQTYVMLGYDRLHVRPTLQGFLDRVHPEDKQRVRDILRGLAKPEPTFEGRYRIVRPDGEVRIVYEQGEVERGADGKPVRLFGTTLDITERVRLEEEAAERGRTLQNVLDNMFTFVGVVSLEGIVLDANRAAVEASALPRAETVGKALWDTPYWSYSEDARAQARDVVRRAAAGEIVRIEQDISVAGDAIITADLVFSPLRDTAGRITRILGSGVDITARKKAEHALRESARRLSEAQRIANVGGWEWDLLTNEIAWSEQTFRIFGLDPATTKPSSKTLLDLSHPDDMPKTREAVTKALRERARYDLQHRIIRPDGQVRALHEQGEVQSDAAGRPLRLIGTTQDVTELRAAEAELVEAKLRAESANEAKSRFISNMSHELRTPLNAIIGFSDLMLHGAGQEPLGAKNREYTKDIHDSGQHLLKVINDILDISRVEFGKKTLDEELVDIGDVAGAALRMIQTRADDAGVTVVAHIPPAFPRLRGDRRLLMQVLLNLASNAVKFTEAGGEVRLDARLDADGAMMLSMHDSGIGMSAEELARIGEPFVQIDSRLARKYDGAGLGLVITKRLVQLHDGTLSIDSEAGRGTTVTVRLPAARVATAPPAMSA